MVRKPWEAAREETISIRAVAGVATKRSREKKRNWHCEKITPPAVAGVDIERANSVADPDDRPDVRFNRRRVDAGGVGAPKQYEGARSGQKWSMGDPKQGRFRRDRHVPGRAGCRKKRLAPLPAQGVRGGEVAGGPLSRNTSAAEEALLATRKISTWDGPVWIVSLPFTTERRHPP
jgi:hypothetical protein